MRQNRLKPFFYDPSWTLGKKTAFTLLWVVFVIIPWMLIAQGILNGRGYTMEEVEALKDWQNPVVWAGCLGVVSFWIFITWQAGWIRKWWKKKEQPSENQT